MPTSKVEKGEQTTGSNRGCSASLALGGDDKKQKQRNGNG